jgi:hypothetical protein
MSNRNAVVLFSLFMLLNLTILGQRSGTDGEPFDTYSLELSWQRQRFNLDNFAAYLRRFPDTTGYIAYFVGDRDNAGKVRRQAERSKRYLVTQRTTSKDRVVVLCGGMFDNSRMSLYLIKKGGATPDFGPCP